MARGRERLRREGRAVRGTVTGVKRCWWLKVNTRAARYSALDGARFPHSVSYRYAAEGAVHTGKERLSWRLDPPEMGAEVQVRYDPAAPGCSCLDIL